MSTLIVGTGGLGTGLMVRLEGNQTLGREESRFARAVDQKDRCKLHDVAFAVKALAPSDTSVALIGAVGADGPGEVVMKELEDSAFDTSQVVVRTDRPSLYSVCFTYPDGQGGNITLDDSASALLSAEDVEVAWHALCVKAGKTPTIVFAVPEVPLSARRRLLELGTKVGALRVASFLSGEIAEAREEGLFDLIDLFALNSDESATLVGKAAASAEDKDLMDAVVDTLGGHSRKIQIVMTSGSKGSWVWDGTSVSRTEAIPARVANSAGAGDSHLGALIAGLSRGYSLVQSNELATAVSSLKVQCLDSIRTDITMSSVSAYARSVGRSLRFADDDTREEKE